ncbi:hypothetical protein Tco_1410389 [Tanacetum coccineum]
MGEPLSPDRVFDFPVDDPHPTHDFFASASLLGYAGNPNNNNGWLEADDHLLGELEAMVDEQVIVRAVEEVAEPMVEAEEQMVAPVIDMEEDLIALFGEDEDFEDDDSEGFEEEEAWEVNDEWLMAPVTPPHMPFVQPSSVYEVRGPSIVAVEGPSFPLPAPGLPGSDAEVAASVTVGEIGPRIVTVKGQMQVMASQMVQVIGGLEQIHAQMG